MVDGGSQGLRRGDNGDLLFNGCKVSVMQSKSFWRSAGQDRAHGEQCGLDM